MATFVPNTSNHVGPQLRHGALWTRQLAAPGQGDGRLPHSGCTHGRGDRQAQGTACLYAGREVTSSVRSGSVATYACIYFGSM